MAEQPPEVWYSPSWDVLVGASRCGCGGCYDVLQRDDTGWYVSGELSELPGDAVRLVPATDGVTAGLLRALAAGGREYAGRVGDSSDDVRDNLLAEAATWDLAALIVSGDYGPLYDLLPSWRWTEEMHERALKGTSRDTTTADVAALARHTEETTVTDHDAVLRRELWALLDRDDQHPYRDDLLLIALIGKMRGEVAALRAAYVGLDAQTSELRAQRGAALTLLDRWQEHGVIGVGNRREMRQALGSEVGDG